MPRRRKRKRGFARIVRTPTSSNPTAVQSFSFANYHAAIPVSPDTRGCLCFRAPATRRTSDPDGAEVFVDDKFVGSPLQN